MPGRTRSRQAISSRSKGLVRFLSPMKLSSTMKTMSFQPRSLRSEERRVGKECRYWRDWSSDVCSSDLLPPGDQLAEQGLGAVFVADEVIVHNENHVLPAPEPEIGRASCRERV